MAAQQDLHAVPSDAIHKRFLFAGIPLTAIGNFADIGTVGKNLMDGAAVEPGHRRAVDDPFVAQPPDQGVERQRLIGVPPKDFADDGGRSLINDDHAPPIPTHVGVAVGRHADEPSLLHSSSHSLANVDRLLLGVEARHIGQRPSHHSPGRIIISRLRDGEKRNAIFGLEAFQLDVIEEIARGAIDLVEEQTVERRTFPFGVGDHFAEDLSLFAVAGGLGNAIKLDDRSASLLGVASQPFLLHLQRESLSLLLATTDARKRDVPFHGIFPCNGAVRTTRCLNDRAERRRGQWNLYAANRAESVTLQSRRPTAEVTAYFEAKSMPGTERFRFSLRMLLTVTAICAVAVMSIRTGGWLWTRIWFSLALGILLASFLGVIYRSGIERAFWVGFALFGWTYWTLANVPVFRIAEHQLFGRQLAESWKNYAPADNPGVVIQAGEIGISIFSFSQTLSSASALLFAVLGGFVARWFYWTRANKPTSGV